MPAVYESWSQTVPLQGFATTLRPFQISERASYGVIKFSSAI
jgi:hypothetical protein